jgi:hypothetical protein
MLWSWLLGAVSSLRFGADAIGPWTSFRVERERLRMRDEGLRFGRMGVGRWLKVSGVRCRSERFGLRADSAATAPLTRSACTSACPVHAQLTCQRLHVHAQLTCQRLHVHAQLTCQRLHEACRVHAQLT